MKWRPGPALPLVLLLGWGSAAHTPQVPLASGGAAAVQPRAPAEAQETAPAPQRVGENQTFVTLNGELAYVVQYPPQRQPTDTSSHCSYMLGCPTLPGRESNPPGRAAFFRVQGAPTSSQRWHVSCCTGLRGTLRREWLNMYEAYWGLGRAPFQTVPDPAFFCPLPAHQEILEKLPYVVQYGKGAALLTGDLGCGKSTLSRVFLQELDPEKYEVGLLINPSWPAEELLHEIALQLGVSAPSPRRSALFRSLYDHLLASAQAGKTTVLILDEAQTITEEAVFEDLRLLLNLQLNDRYLLSLILIGLPELRTTLSKLTALNQRIAVRLNLSYLNEEETAFYIRFRLEKAGATRPIFTDEAITAIYREAGGIPRNINNLCDLCLFEGWKRKAREVDAESMARPADLVKGSGPGPLSPGGGSAASRRLADVVRQAAEPAAPVQDRTPRRGPANGFHLTPHEAPSMRTVLPKEGTEGPGLEDLEADNQVLQRAVAVVEEILEAVRAHAPVSVSSASAAVEMLLQSLEASDALLVPFFSAGSHFPSPAREAVNVCILSVKIGFQLKYAKEELRELGLAALLCDIGMARMPPQILGKRGPLTPEERALLETHQRAGAEILRELEPQHAWLAGVVKRRYETRDGPPDPKDRVEQYATIIRLTDIYESFVHHRPFRQRIGPLEALQEILRRERSRFPDQILKALIRALSAFPVGSLVRLNTGEIGRVVARNRDFPLGPVVEVLVRGGTRLETPAVIDLSQNPLQHIQDSVAEEALP